MTTLYKSGTFWKEDWLQIEALHNLLAMFWKMNGLVAYQDTTQLT